MGDGNAILEHVGSAAWAVVLAGGERIRLRPLTRKVFGDERPKSPPVRG